MNYFEKSLKLHWELKWKIDFKSKASVDSMDALATLYSPWVSAPCMEIAKNPEEAYKYTIKQNTIAVISDWSAVLGLWNIWALAWLPVMEGKCILLKELGWVNAFPIVLDTQDTEEIIKTIKYISPTIWWINLEDISAPRCFEIEERLKKELNIPVFHDDQHWTAIVVLAWLINSLKIVSKEKEDVKIVVNWLWAAWTAIVKLLLLYWFDDIITCDSKWIISKDRKDLNPEKIKILEITNKNNISWSLTEAVKGTDIFIWVSKWNILTKEMIESMNKDPIVFAMANPIPEIMPEEAKEAGVRIMATWRSDYPNQLNNVLVFPWLFKWALENRVSQITDKMKIDAAIALAWYVENPREDNIIPSALDKNVADIVAGVIREE